MGLFQWPRIAEGFTSKDLTFDDDGANITITVIPKEKPYVPTGTYNEFDLSAYKSELSGCEYMEFFRRNEDVDGSPWIECLGYALTDNSVTESLNTDIVLSDRNAEKGRKYSYKVEAYDQSGNNVASIDLGMYVTAEGLGEIVLKDGKATFSSDLYALVFSELPSYQPDDLAVNQILIRYNDKYRQHPFQLYTSSIKNGVLSLSTGWYQNAGGKSEYQGLTLQPECCFCTVENMLEDGSAVYYISGFNFAGDQTDLPEISFPLQ